MKTKYPDKIMVFELVISDGCVKPSPTPTTIHIFTWPQLGGPHQMSGGGSAALVKRLASWKILLLTKGTLLHATQILATSPQTFACQTLECNPLDYYVLGTVDPKTKKKKKEKKENSKKLCATPKMNWRQAFTNLKKNPIGEACRGFRSCMAAMVEAKGDFFE